MTLIQETYALMLAVAWACALPGTFLVLRRMALLGDAISHVLLLGIVATYLVVRDASSVWLYLGATGSGLLAVLMIEALQKRRYVSRDAAIGLVFPALFSLGTILASLYTRGTHLDVDTVLLGHAELVSQLPLVKVGSVTIGRLTTVMLFVVFMLNLLFVVLCYKELKLSTLDPLLAAALGFAPALLHYLLVSLVSLTTVAAFDAVGPVLVLGFLVLPPMTALLLSHRLAWVLILSTALGSVAALVGVWLSFRLNTNIAGTTATVLGGQFALVRLFASGGWLSEVWKNHRLATTELNVAER